MEYGIFISNIRTMPTDPRSVCAGWEHLLPPAPLAAVYFGSEFCIDLLPVAETVIHLCRWARDTGLEAVLLTPVVTPDGLSRIEHLLGELAASGYRPAVVFNDWGVLNLLRRSCPEFRRRAGRLMNRGLRDPRLPEGKSTGVDGTHTGRGRLRSLLLQFGVEALETDPDPAVSYLGDKVAGLQRVLHFPYLFTATGRNCLVKAEQAPSPDACFTKGLGLPCAGACHGRWHEVRRADCERPLWRSGNTIFHEVSRAAAGAQLALADRVVLYERPTA
ncbi:MAG TPA: hypothetical protein VLH58_07050 [Candidatus Methylomirabilis sp.]|nr:hypothetical protein [Candidatus Methylomirabilis sp.]